jgi:hypothetical protein
MLYFLDLGVGANFEPSQGLTGGKIMTASSDGSRMKVLIDGLASPDGIDVSISSGRIFWTSMGTPGKPDGSVLSAKLDGSDIKTVIPKGVVNTPKQLTIDQLGSKVYFCKSCVAPISDKSVSVLTKIGDREGLSVHRCNYDGTVHEVIVQCGDWEKDGFEDQTKWCVGVTLDHVHGKFYWTQKGTPKGGQGRIFRAGIEFPSGETASSRSDIELLYDHLPEPVDLEIDSQSQTLYWTDRGEYPLGNTLSKAEVGPEGNKKIITLARHFHEAIGMKLDTVNHHIYITDLGGAIYRVAMNGLEKHRIIDTDNALTGIALVYVN